MHDEWEYQVRINVSDDYAEILRRDLGDPAVKPIADILSKHRATLKSPRRCHQYCSMSSSSR